MRKFLLGASALVVIFTFSEIDAVLFMIPTLAWVYTLTSGQMWADGRRVIAVAVRSVDIPPPRCKLLAVELVVRCFDVGASQAAMIAKPQGSHPDLFTLERDCIFVVLWRNVSISCLAYSN